MQELWLRTVFSILISNTDDHLRNHGFLWTGTEGWRLSPAFDLNPVPTDIKPRVLTTTIDNHDGTASLKLALEVAPYFGLSSADVKDGIAGARRCVSGWRSVALGLGLSGSEADRMASAFEFEDED